MARKSRPQIWLEYIAARAVLGMLGLLPRRAALFLSIGLARLMYRLLGGLRRVGMRNLEIAFPERSVDERREILKGTFENLGRVLGEVSQFMKTTPAALERIVDFDLDAESVALYHLNKTEKRGVLITTGHFGNWEMLVFAFAALHEPIAYLARPIDNPLIEELTVRIRTRFGNRPINKTNSAQLAIKILREGGILGILADVNAHPKEGVFVPFFGVPACTTAGAALIALRSDALIFPTFCVWDKEIKRYRIVHGRVLEPVRTGDRERDILETTAAYTAEIERIYRQYPEQWMWIHKRWKTRPKGEPSLY
ncbi:MAG: lysophospholipid acyltransferase family protein [Pyrinomonadaceae bacterium]